MRVAILGLGLIGGSIARALAGQDGGGWHVVAWSRSNRGPRQALADGVVESVAADPAAAVADADLVVLAASPAGNIELCGTIGPLLAGRNTTLTDVSSVQVPIARAARRVPGLRFVGGHPLAGRESRGFEAADAALFLERTWVVVPGPDVRAIDVERVERLTRACGAVPRLMEAAVHDHLAAAISHLPLLTSAALAEAVVSSAEWPQAAALAAGGWRDTTRLARGDPELGAGIAAGNAPEILYWLSRLEAVLVSWRGELERLAAPDAADLAPDGERGTAPPGDKRGAEVPAAPEAPDGAATIAAIAARLERVRAALIELPGAGIGDPGAAEPAVDLEATSGGG